MSTTTSNGAGTLTIDASGLGSAGVDFGTYIADFFAATSGSGGYNFYGGIPNPNPYSPMAPAQYLNGDQIAYHYGTGTSRAVMEGEVLAYDFFHYGASYGHGLSGKMDGLTFGQWVDGTTTATRGLGPGNGLIEGLDEEVVITGFGLEVAPGTTQHTPTNTNLIHMVWDALSGRDADTLNALVATYAQHFVGTSGNDTYVGSAFDDEIDGRAGADRMTGGTGNDIYHVDNAGDRVVEKPGEGTDTVHASVNYALAGNVENLVLAGSASISGTGNALANVITGNAGHNTLKGGAGNDTIDGAAGNDRVHGGGGNDILKGAVGHDRLYGEAGHDRLYGEAGNDALYGGSGNDSLYGGDGNDTLRGSAGNDRLSGDAGNDRLYGDAGNDRVYGGAGEDSLYGGSNGDVLYGGAGNDRLSGDAGNDRLYGDAGNDRLYGGADRDILYGGAGDDQLVGGRGADRLFGGEGSDTFVFRAISDSTVRPSGRDTIYSFDGEGGDRINLRGIDASTKLGGNQAFDFIGTESFSNTAGELRYEKRGGDTLVLGDVNGDGKADFSIRLDKAMDLSEGYFML